LKDAAVVITDSSGSAIAMRLTNRSGRLDSPVEISVPELSASQSPNTGVIPYATVNLYAKKENFEEIEIQNLQVFADTISDQDLPMIPLSELPGQWNKAEVFPITPQNL